MLFRALLAARPCEYLPDRFELDFGQMCRVRASYPDDLDRAGQPAGCGPR